MLSYVENEGELALVITISTLNQRDLYWTYRGIYKNRECVVKFWIHEAREIESNEYEVIQYLKSNSNNKHLYPEPYFTQDLNVKIDSIPHAYKVICYEFLQGNTLDNIKLSKKRYNNLVRDLSFHMKDLDNMNIVHGDIKPRNTLMKEDGSFIFIDYGNSFSTSISKFPLPYSRQIGPYALESLAIKNKRDFEDFFIVIQSKLNR